MCPQLNRRISQHQRSRPASALASRYLNLRRVFRASPNPYLVLKMDAPRFTVVEVTDSYLQLTHTSRAGIVGRGLFDVVPPQANDVGGNSNAELRASLLRAAETGVPDVMAVQKFYTRPSGGTVEERYWNRINTPVLDERHTVLRIIHCIDDVTSAVRLAEKTVAAERTAQMKSAFVARMSHELRTPMNAIDGYVQLLELGLRGSLTEMQREYFTRIRHSEEHLLSLIDELLELTRAEAGRTEYRMERVSVIETLAAVEELTAPQLQARGLNYQFVVDDQQLAIHADADKVRRIVANLVTNALKNTDAGGTIRIDADRADDYIGIHVRDSGHGIDPTQLEKIFEPFVQLPGTSPGARGFGLGLSICRELARGMGGDILVESEPGRGSTFTLVLKHYREQSAPTASGAQPQSENAADD